MRILIFTINPLHNAPRVIREIDALKDDFEIIATGITPPHDSSVAYLDSNKIALSHFEYNLGKIYRVLFFGKVFLGKYASTQWKINRLLKEVTPDIVIVHPGAFLPYFFKKDRKYKIIFNAHEFHPKEFESNPRWKNTWGKIYDSIYKKYLPSVDLLINVCDGIAEECKSIYGKSSIVIPNAAPYYPDLFPSKVVGTPFKMIHHGVAIRERNLELMLDLAGKLSSDFLLDMLLVYQDRSYFDELVSLSKKYTNIRILPPVDFDHIVPYLNQYDIGLFLLPPFNFNYLHALPNKLFEFIQARLCIAVGPSPEMAAIVEKYNLGVVSKDFSVSSLEAELRKLDSNSIRKYKEASHLASAQLNAEKYFSNFKAEINKLIQA